MSDDEADYDWLSPLWIFIAVLIFGFSAINRRRNRRVVEQQAQAASEQKQKKYLARLTPEGREAYQILQVQQAEPVPSPERLALIKDLEKFVKDCEAGYGGDTKMASDRLEELKASAKAQKEFLSGHG